MDKKNSAGDAGKIVLEAEERKLEGRKVKILRAGGILPGNIFGKKIKSRSIQVGSKDFQNVYKEAGSTGIVELVLKGEKVPTLIHSVQLNPKSDEVLHIDFHQIDLKEKIEAEVPVELIGQSPAEKTGLGTVVQYINEIRVEALPADLPEKFEIDTSVLVEVDQTVYIKDLKVDREKVEIKNEQEEIVVKVEPPQKEEVVETPVAEEGAEGAEATVAAEGVIPPEGEKTEEAAKEEVKE